jgi:hypothetical protein
VSTKHNCKYVQVLRSAILDRKLNKFLKGKTPKAKADQPCQHPPQDGFGSIPGVYNNAAYGDLKLCALSSTPQDDNSLQEPNWSFAADVNKAFVKEFLFEHFDKDIFNVTAKLKFPETGAVMWDMIGQGIQARFGRAEWDFNISGAQVEVSQMATWRAMASRMGLRCSLPRLPSYAFCTEPIAMLYHAVVDIY